MKSTIITLVLAFAILAGHTQPLGYYPGNISFSPLKCGTWQEQPAVTTDWETVDTLGDKHITSTQRHWIYNAEEQVSSNTWTDAMYAPCGRGGATIYEQYRICSLTGIRQVKKRTISYKYIPPVPTDYERVVDSLTAKKTAELYGATAADTVWGIKASGWITNGNIDTTNSFPSDFTRITNKEDPDNLAKNRLYPISYDTIPETRWTWNKRKFDRDTREPKKVYALYPRYWDYFQHPEGFLDLKRKPLKSRYWVIGEKVKEGGR